MNKFYKKLFSVALLSGTVLISAQVYDWPIAFEPSDVSNKGEVVGKFENFPAKWTNTTGVNTISDTYAPSLLYGRNRISDDGKKIAATVAHPETLLIQMGLYDVDTKKWTYMGGLPNGIDGDDISSVYGMTSDGKAVVGLAYVSNFIGQGVYWTEEKGLQSIGTSVPQHSTRINGISDDQSIMVGYQDEENNDRSGVYWENGKQTFIDDDEGYHLWEVSEISGDGKWITGSKEIEPTIWSKETGLTIIDHPQSGNFFRGMPVAINHNGSRVVGFFRQWPGPAATGEGFLWTPENGRVNLNEYVEGLGLVTNDVIFSLPLAMSSNGKYITGIGRKDGELVGFMIDLSTKLGVTEHESKLEKIVISPNPVQDILTISTVDNIKSITVFSVVGQKVLTPQVKNKTINVSSLAKGVYILQIETKSGKNQQKFIKK